MSKVLALVVQGARKVAITISEAPKPDVKRIIDAIDDTVLDELKQRAITELPDFPERTAELRFTFELRTEYFVGMLRCFQEIVARRHDRRQR